MTSDVVVSRAEGERLYLCYLFHDFHAKRAQAELDAMPWWQVFKRIDLQQCAAHHLERAHHFGNLKVRLS